MAEPGGDSKVREASVFGETRVEAEAMEDGDAAGVGLGMSGAAEGQAMGGVSTGEDKDLKYLHLLWEPGRAELCAGGAASPLRKMSGSRARRQHRRVRNLGPIGNDVYGKYIHLFKFLLGSALTLIV